MRPTRCGSCGYMHRPSFPARKSLFDGWASVFRRWCGRTWRSLTQPLRNAAPRGVSCHKRLSPAPEPGPTEQKPQRKKKKNRPWLSHRLSAHCPFTEPCLPVGSHFEYCLQLDGLPRDEPSNATERRKQMTSSAGQRSSPGLRGEANARLLGVVTT